MPTARELSIRGTPIHMLQEGNGPDLLFLHGAGGAGRWLPFQEHLAKRYTVHFPSHPGHGGSPAAEWIEHISDLAFHYLDLLDELGLPRVHLVGASFGGWIAAELATMASHRLASLALIDPVGIRVEGWIYPFLFAMDIPELVATVFHNPMAALALAPPDRSCAAGCGASRRRRCSAGAPTTGSRRFSPAARPGPGRSRRRGCACSPTPGTCPTSRSPTRSRRR
jgi:pimeloyl-ACP methyl ester carboxylesterase